MKEIRYKDFSLNTHKNNWQAGKPNVCQFELTFKCGLRCRHCYTDCYNNPSCIAKELRTGQIKLILDKVYDAGAIWLCLTGGDPLAREDFPEIYSYAKRKGFIVTIFTNGYSMTEETADFLAGCPPFVLEFTLNAVTKDLYEKITQVKGSYEKMTQGLNMILDRGLPLKIKTQLTKDNFDNRDAVKKFVEGIGLTFRPSLLIYPRLNKDMSPCGLRLSSEEILGLNGKIEKDCLKEQGGASASASPGTSDHIFRCAVGSGDGFSVDPYGNMFLCNLIRKPSVNLLTGGIEDAAKKIITSFRGRKFKSDSKCRVCSLRDICYNCPGNSYLETGDEEAPIEYYCGLARELSCAVPSAW